MLPSMLQLIDRFGGQAAADPADGDHLGVELSHDRTCAARKWDSVFGLGLAVFRRRGKRSCGGQAR